MNCHMLRDQLTNYVRKRIQMIIFLEAIILTSNDEITRYLKVTKYNKQPVNASKAANSCITFLIFIIYIISNNTIIVKKNQVNNWFSTSQLPWSLMPADHMEMKIANHTHAKRTSENELYKNSLIIHCYIQIITWFRFSHFGNIFSYNSSLALQSDYILKSRKLVRVN